MWESGPGGNWKILRLEMIWPIEGPREGVEWGMGREEEINLEKLAGANL